MSETSTRGDYQEQWAHINPQYLIRKTKGFVVFIDKENDLDWETTQEYDAGKYQGDGPLDSAARNSILNDAALLEGIPTEGLQPRQILQFKRLIGEALACSFEHDYGNAGKMLVASAKYVRDRSEEKSRWWYLWASFVMAIPFALLSSAIWLWRQQAMVLLGTQGMWLFLSIGAGALGALLSVIARSGRLQLDCAAGKWLHYLEGGSRIWAGALSGFLVALAVRYEIVFAPLSRDGKMPGVMLMAAFIGGAGERLASSIISKFESTPKDVASTKKRRQEAPGGADHE
jgi:hypothetical protein